MLERKVGDIRITRVIESERPDYDAGQFFPTLTPEHWAPYRQRLSGWAMDTASNGLVFPMQSFLVRTAHHTIVVDTCVGDHKKRLRPNWNMTTSGEFLKRFAETGVRPEQVDYVLCTHMHTDHVGWNTRLENGRWVPTFPNAKYIVAGEEWEYWRHEKDLCIADSVVPIVESAQAMLVESHYAVDQWLSFEPSPGHTPGHVSVRLSTSGGQAVFSGDLMHRIVQVAEPQWSSRFCADPKRAAVTRREFVERHADSGVLILAAHFPRPGFIVREGGGTRFIPSV